MIRTIIFDLDGTLVDSAPDITHAMNRLLADKGAKAQQVAFVEQFIGEGATQLVAKIMAALQLPVADLKADVQRYIDYYRERPVIDSRLYADAASAIPMLHAAGVRLGVCTNKNQRLAETVLETLGIADYLDVVVGADTTAYCKPDPRPLLYAVGQLGGNASESIFVGDTAIDRDCALAANVACRIVDWGTGPAVAISKECRLKKFADLLPATAAA